MYKTDVFISAEEIKEIVGISKSKAYSLIVSASKEGVVHNRSFFVILTTDSFEALFISYFKPAGIW